MINSQYNSPPSAATVVSCGSWSDHHPSIKSSPMYLSTILQPIS